MDGALQITNELNVGGTGTTAGSAGTAGQVLTSNGASAAPVWKSVSSIADTTNDAWVNDNTNTQVKLGTKSNGTAARDTGTEFVIKDDGKVGIGLTAPTRPLEVNGEAKALRIIARGPGNFPTNLALGDNSLASLTTGTSNAAVGPDALKANTAGGGNTAVGASALLKASTGNNNTAIGKDAMSNVTTGIQNVAVGTGAMGSADAGNHNVAVGYNAGLLLNNVATNNTFIGWQSGLTTSSGTGNTFIGGSSGLNVTTGSNNTIIGSYTGSATINNNIVLSDGAGNQRIRVIDDGKTGIGTTTPQKQLHVDGALQITNELNVGGTGTTAGSAGTAGQVLTSNGTNAAPQWTTINPSVANITKVSANYTVTATDYTILANATSAGFTVTLPAAAANTGRFLVIRKTDETSNTLTFSSSIKQSETTSFTTLNVNATIRIQSDGTNWYKID